MDLQEVRPGTTVTLPVFQPGGLLFIGDLHASMGAGEACWVGLEAAGVAIVRVTVTKHDAPPFPRSLTMRPWTDPQIGKLHMIAQHGQGGQGNSSFPRSIVSFFGLFTTQTGYNGGAQYTTRGFKPGEQVTSL